jgi:16S rRNA (adenine1518-N6/adenine1519-N6)-dimethyltransferase
MTDEGGRPHRPRKRFGQHFLRDTGVVHRILRAAAPEPGQHFVEIGPGEGILTRPLLAATGRLDVVELDRDLAAALSGEDLPGLTVHGADALRFDYQTLAPPGELRVVGNLPYNISTPLLFHLLTQAEAIRDMHFMLQREVVTRMAAGPGGGDYGRLSVMVQYRCRVERLFTVPPGAFRPPPKVNSAVVRLIPYRSPPVDVGDEIVFRQVVAAAFSQRRKTLRNALRDVATEAELEAAGIDPGERAEQLSLSAFADISRSVLSNKA